MISEELPLRGSDARESTDRLGALDFWFLAAVFCATLIVAWADIHAFKGDSIAYYDLSEAVRLHRWQACFNASWFPLYPAVLTAARALFHFDPRYDGAAARLVNFAAGLALMGSAVFFAFTVRRHVAATRPGEATRGILTRPSLLLLTVTFTFFFWCVDLGGEKPDTVLAVFLLLATAFLLRGITCGAWWPFVVSGVLAGCAYWTKAFAFPYVCLMVFFLALSQWKNRRALLQLTVAAVAFLAVASPYIAHISAEKHRFTIGDAGRLNSAWYVNGAERQNPVADAAIDDRGTAAGAYLHPADLLATNPEIVYFAPGHVFGHMPAWDDFSYWSDGLAPRLSPRGSARALYVDLRDFLKTLPFRVQVLALFAVLWIFGLRWRRNGPRDLVLTALAAAALVSLGLYLLVHFEGRYIVFTVVICAAIAACTARSGEPVLQEKLHRILLVVCLLFVVVEAQAALRGMHASATGDEPTHLRFDMPEYHVGQALQERFGAGAQVACMGQEACYNDAMWAWYGKSTVSAVVTMPHQQELSALGMCRVLQQDAPLEAMRTRQIRAVVTWFGADGACGPAWQTVPGAPGYFVLAL